MHDMIPIESSNISGARYSDKTLFLRFHSGDIYRYDNVPEATYRGLISAESAGKFFHANIRGKYAYVKTAMT